ncbi:MAG: hypothetical protein J0M11_12965 [Anaerolineae bacterium]|nr:hypothetical protein [Anaerolineae bacterium]
MNNKRENDLWKQIDRLIFIIALLGLIILIGAYFIISNTENIDPILQGLILNVILNTIPTSILFVGAYLVFRHIEKLRAERDSEELANKVVLRLVEIAKIQTSKAGEDTNFLEDLPDLSGLYLKITHELEITKKAFDYKSKQQKLVIEFTNRGSNVIQLKKITYSDMTFGLPKAILSKNYRVDEGRDYLIPVDHSQSEILPGGKYVVNILLDGKHDTDKINAWIGKWGYLHLEIVYGTEMENVQYAI